MKGDCPDSPAADSAESFQRWKLSAFDADWKELSPLHRAHLFTGRYLFASRWLREPPVAGDLPQVVADPFEGFIITLDLKHLVS